MPDSGPMQPENPQDRVADLERRLAEANRVIDLERELAEAKAGAAPEQDSPTSVSPASMPPPSAQSAPGFQMYSPAQMFADQQQQFGQPAGGALNAAPFRIQRGGAAPVDTRLALAPRRIPAVFLLVDMLRFRFWYVWAMFMVAVAPISLWISVPAAFAAAAVSTLVAIYAVNIVTARTRRELLKWGQVATVTGSEITSQGTYYSGTTYSNMIVPVAHGWTVTRSMYSGPKTKTRVRYTLDGYQGELTVRGREYIDGVILADQRNPARALCVTSFPYDLDRDTEGNWVGKLRTAQAIGMVVWVLIVAGWLVAAAVSVNVLGLGSVVGWGGPAIVDAGRTLTIDDMDVTKAVVCNNGSLDISGMNDTITVTGHCANVSVSGMDDHVTLDSADSISNDDDDTVTFHSGSPQITGDGSGKVQRG
jgi:hypothetical protein